MTDLEFKPLYYGDKQKIVGSNENFEKDRLNIVNPRGRAGIVTLWTKPWEVWRRLKERNPELFQKESPLVALTSLYGNGLPQMLANLAANPQIEYLAIIGTDTKVVPSSRYLINFLEQGVEMPQIEGQLGKIRGTEFPIDPQLRPEMFKHLKVRRFGNDDLEGLVSFLKNPETRQVGEENRVRLKLIEPEFKDFPSDLTTHVVEEKTPLEAWSEVIYLINRFGRNVQLGKGVRRTLYNLEVNVGNPAPGSFEELKKFNFDPEELNAYRESIVKGELPTGMTYTYGNRMRKYFEVDALENIITRLKKDPMDRRAFITLWDNKTDIISPEESDSSVPCLTGIYLVNNQDKLMLTADFRTHSAVSAWLLNLYGLRAIQEFVAKETGIEPGKINVKSRYIGIDPNDGRTNKAIELIGRYRKKRIDVEDPRGFFVAEIEGDEIVLDHYSPNSSKLKRYRGKTAIEIKNQLRQDSAIDNPDHANWVGIKLGALHYKLHNEIPE